MTRWVLVAAAVVVLAMAGGAVADAPFPPTNLANTTGNFWVNHTWDAGGCSTGWYIIFGNAGGWFRGYNWDGSAWQGDSWIISGLGDVGTYSAPTVFQKDGTWYLISGVSKSQIRGFKWTGSAWQSYSGIVSGISFQMTYCPTVFQKDGTWYLIMTGQGYRGYKWTGSAWQSDSGIISGLGSGVFSAVFQKGGAWYLIAGNNGGTFTGYNWTGSAWQSDSGIVSGLGDVGSYSAPSVFQKDGTWYLISGSRTGAKKSYNWTGSAWQDDPGIAAGLPGTGIGYGNIAAATFNVSSTDSYNISVNSVWHNGTTDRFWKGFYSAHAWQNIEVYAYSASGTGTLSLSSISQNTQIPNNPVTITNLSHWAGEVGTNLYVDCNSTDPDGDTPTYSCSRTDLFTDFDTANGTGNWTVIAGVHYVDFGVSDGWGSTSNYTMQIRPYATSPPMILAQTHEQTWVNWTWKEQGGAYYAADSWNVSVDGVWHNTTTVMHYNHTGLDYFQTSSIVVWGYNNTSQHLSYESVSGTCIISPKYGNYTIIEKKWKGNVTFNRTHEGGQSVDVIGSGDGNIYWWANDGEDSPTFTGHVLSTNGALTVGATDFDGDGDIDILEDGEAWWENDGDEHFTRHTHGMGQGYDGGVAADINNDGDMDVIGYWRNQGTMYYGVNNGVGGFSYWILPSVGYTYDITTGDFDNDGDLDVVAAIGTGEVYFLEQVTSGTWTRHTISSEAGSAYTVFAKDYNKDGNLDVLVSLAQPSDAHGVRWYIGDGNGGFSKSEYPLNDTTGADNVRVVSGYVADLNWDDNLDILGMSYYPAATLSWIWEDTDEYSIWWFGDGAGWSWASMYANDLNGDGNIDAVYATGWGNSIGYALGAGNGGSYSTGYIPTSVHGAWNVFAIDIDGDYIILRKNYAGYEPSGDITTRIYEAASNWTGVEIGGYNMPGTSAHAYWYHSPDNITFQMKDLGEVNFGSYINLTATAPDEKYGYLKIVLTTTNDQFSPVLAYMVLYETWCSSYNLVSITDDHGNVVKCGKVAAYDETAGEYDYKWEDNTDGYVLLQDVNAHDHDILLTLKTFDGVFTLNTVRPKYGVTDERTTEWIIPIHYNLRVYPVDIHDEPLFNVFCGLSEYTPLDPQAFWGYSMTGSQYVPVTNCSGFAVCDLIAEKGGYEDYNATALNWTSKSALVKDYRHTIVMEKD